LAGILIQNWLEKKGMSTAIANKQNRGSNQLETGKTGSAKKTFAFFFTDEDFEYIRSLIYKVAGISLSSSKKDLVYSRLSRRLRARQIDSFNTYIQLLESGDVQEREEFTNALTTNMTSFFREPHHFKILSNHLGAISKSKLKPIHIWTCASSTGEEPYSIAITVAEHFQSFKTQVRILATDIDTNVLEKAKQGQYALQQLQTLSSSQIKRFFLKGSGRNTGLAKVRPELQQMITFKRINLLDNSWGVREKFDAVFCRNVMIYFDKSTQYEILRKMHPCIQPNGLFFAGHSENFHQAADLFRIQDRTVYTPKSFHK
jgi:chemotaxis protein methyltransferase CheR